VRADRVLHSFFRQILLNVKASPIDVRADYEPSIPLVPGAEGDQKELRLDANSLKCQDPAAVLASTALHLPVLPANMLMFGDRQGALRPIHTYKIAWRSCHRSRHLLDSVPRCGDQYYNLFKTDELLPFAD
jgi:hypothetical protein